MNKNELCVKTKRMLIQPMSDEEIENLIDTSDSDELRNAYSEMLSGCKSDPENRIWYAPWKMTLKKDHTYIGDLGFKGPVRDNAVEIGYGILPEHEGKGYTTEAVQAMTQWAFGNADIVFIEAETEPENRASQRILEKCGFVPDGEGKEGPRFVLEKPLANKERKKILKQREIRKSKQ
ncbi:MAG: GNAT family N-acetyltransferase [Muricoprocola sp.]